MALNIDTDELRRASEFVGQAADFLHPDLNADVPCCGGDGVSEAVMNNLNAWRRWLLELVGSGARQADAAGAGMIATAAGFEAQDAAGAAGYGGAGSVASVPLEGAPTAGGRAPNGMPTFSPIPDLSGTEGEELARQLEAGSGAGPAIGAGTHLATLSARAAAANASLVMAQGHIVASGESMAHPGLMRRLSQAIIWTAGVAGHADALSAGYGSAAALHTTTMASVGPSAEWSFLKTSYTNAVLENQMTGGLSQPKVDAIKASLTGKETLKSSAMQGYELGGDKVSTPPGDLPDPGLEPNSTGDQPSEDGKPEDLLGASDDEDASEFGDMLSPLMGALGPLTQSLGKANPLSSLGQAAQQLGQQVGQLGGDALKKASSPLTPAALAKSAELGKGKGSGGGKGGGSPIKPSSPLAGVRAASLSGSPSASPSAGEPIKPAAASGARAASGAGSGGMGMMPMGARGAGGSGASKIDSYEDPLAEVAEQGRPGVVGDAQAAKAAPAVEPDAKNAVKERLARRKRDAATDGQS